MRYKLKHDIGDFLKAGTVGDYSTDGLGQIFVCASGAEFYFTNGIMAGMPDTFESIGKEFTEADMIRCWAIAKERGYRTVDEVEALIHELRGLC